MSKEIKDAEIWVDGLTAAMHELELFVVKHYDVINSYDLGQLSGQTRRFEDRLKEKASLLAKLKREEEANVDG
jgi:hypothetical protein